MASKGLTECWRDAMAAKPADWRLMGVACGPREVDPKSTAPMSGAPGREVRDKERLEGRGSGPQDALLELTVKAQGAARVIARRLRWTLLPMAVSLAACGVLDPIPRPTPLTAEVARWCGFPVGTELAFDGVASPLALGLGTETDTTPVQLYVTAGPVRRADRRDAPPQRWACFMVEGGGGWYDVPENWTPPAQ